MKLKLLRLLSTLTVFLILLTSCSSKNSEVTDLSVNEKFNSSGFFKEQQRVSDYNNKILTRDEVIALCNADLNKRYIVLIDLNNDSKLKQIEGKINNLSFHVTKVEKEVEDGIIVEIEGVSDLKTNTVNKLENITSGNYLCKVMMDSAGVNVGFHLAKQ